MLRRSLLATLVASSLSAACADDGPAATGGGAAAEAPRTRIAFGSCMHQDQPKPVLDRARLARPDAFVFLGDNVYGDTDDMAELAAIYDRQAASPELVRLELEVPLFAIWDDHDYGRNDAGAEYPHKAESKALFLDFWRAPAGSPRRGRDGLYDAYLLPFEGGTVQLLLLDLRWFRDPLEPNDGSGLHDYIPTEDPSRTMLGVAQWAWLEEELRRPADVRIVASSTQLGHSYNGYESWTNMPHERQRLIDAIGAAGAEVTLVISGDAHWAELSRQEVAGGYPLYDLTSSGITEEWSEIPPNDNRVGDAVADNNFGLVDIVWDTDPRITLSIVDAEGATRLSHTLRASELRF